MAVLCVLLSAVCLMDYHSHRIPNRLILVILLYGLGYRYWDTGGGGLAAYLLIGTAVFLLMYPLFKIGVIGAGDVKLFSVTAGYLSWQKSFCFLFISLLIAAMISICKLVKERSGRERCQYLGSYLIQVGTAGHFKMYFDDCTQARKAGICLAGPVLISLLLHMGGAY